ncbi:MAG: universal stress protein [Gemmatimonadaceae bacterium]
MTDQMPVTRARAASHDRTTTSEVSALATGPVLLATSATAHSHWAVKAARKAAHALGAPLQVISIIEPPAMFDPMSGAIPLPLLFDETFRAEREVEVRSFLSTENVQVEDKSNIVQFGSIASAIVRAANVAQAQLVVVGAGTHVRGNEIRSGDLASRLLAALSCPVLSVSERTHKMFDHVVSAIDFSPASIAAAHTALQLVATNGTLVLVHCTSNGEFIGATDALHGATSSNDDANKLVRLRDRFAQWARADVKLEFRQLNGNAATELLNFANFADSGLITVGTHSKGFLERMFVGSVARHIFQHASCNVLGSAAPMPSESVRLLIETQGTATSTEPTAWKKTLELFSARNLGRRARLEVDDADFGAQIQASGYEFMGAQFDEHDARVEFMLGSLLNRSDHLTRGIPNVTSVSIKRDDANRDVALEIRAGGTVSLLTFGD